MNEIQQMVSTFSLTTEIVERIATHRDSTLEDLDFCLYENTDPEALETLLLETEGPLTTRFRIDGDAVTVEKTATGEITVEVD